VNQSDRLEISDQPDGRAELHGLGE
jgi:hypothetical protein